MEVVSFGETVKANTTDAINKFTLIYPFKKGDKVLVSDVEISSMEQENWRKLTRIKVTYFLVALKNFSCYH